MSNKVFVSYSVRDNDVANEICAFLEEFGISYVKAFREMKSDALYENKNNEKALKECRVMVLIWTTSSGSSLHLLKELGWARSECLTVVPYYVGDGSNNQGIPSVYLNILEEEEISLATSEKGMLLDTIYSYLDKEKEKPIGNLKVGNLVICKVVNFTDYGALVEIKPGIVGLIHIKNMVWSKQRMYSPQEFMQIGDTIVAVILAIDRKEHKISLGIKQLTKDPWAKIEKKYPIGSKHTAKIRKFVNFGIFVELEKGVDGMIHISDLSWTKKVKHPSEFTQEEGGDIEVIVLDIDKKKRHLHLGHKQIFPNPWGHLETIYVPGSIHNGVIYEITSEGARIILKDDVEGFTTPKHLVKQDQTLPQVGETLPFVVVEFNKERQRIILSHARTYKVNKGKE